MLNLEQQAIILEVLSPYCPVQVGIFGSFARGEETESSDIDILIDFGQSRLTLFDMVSIGDILESRLGRKVDLVTKNGLSQFLKPKIEHELIIISRAA